MKQKIDRDIVYELRKEATEYITMVKGKNVTKEDIKIAEMLILFGYLKAKLEAKNKNSTSSEPALQSFSNHF